MNNYRPISSIPFISKLMEKVVVSRVVEHLSNNNLMEEYQYLEARTRRVKIDDAISEPIPVTCGVPQVCSYECCDRNRW